MPPPHTLAVPPPPQVSGLVQDPHDAVRVVPQLSFSVRLPQFLPRRLQNAPSVSGAHAVVTVTVALALFCATQAEYPYAPSGKGGVIVQERVPPQITLPRHVPSALHPW